MVTPALDIFFVLMSLELIETLKFMPKTKRYLTFLLIKVSGDICVSELNYPLVSSRVNKAFHDRNQNFLQDCHPVLGLSNKKCLMY